MAAPTIARTVLPPTEPLQALAAMLDGLGAEPTTTLSGPNGEHLVLPPEVFEVLRDGQTLGKRALNLRVVQTDVARGLLLIEGAVPGSKGGWITVRDAVKKALPKDAPKPGKFKLAGETEAAPAGEGA